MIRARIILIASLMLVAGSSLGQAQSTVGEYHGTVLIGDTTGQVTPIEFAQAVDIALIINRSDEGVYGGSVRFRRLYRNVQGQLTDAQAPLAQLTVNENDLTFEATAEPIRILHADRVIERQVTITGAFLFDADPCIGAIEATYSETLGGLVFKPLQLSGLLSMSRTRETEADRDCLAATGKAGQKTKGK